MGAYIGGYEATKYLQSNMNIHIFMNMKTVTIHIEEPVYERFKETAAERGVAAAELIREAMRRFAEDELERGPSLADLKPAVLGPLYARLDLSNLDGEMMDDRA